MENTPKPEPVVETYKPEDYKGPSQFVHLHNHTIFSTMDGVATPDQYAEQCKKRGYPAMAATEHGHMASVPDFYLAFKKQKVKPIFGCEIYYNDWEPMRQDLERRGNKVRSPEWRKNNPELANRIIRARHLTVLAKNETGFRNLVKLTTQAYGTGLFGMGVRQFNRIWFEKLCEFKEGLIVLSGCLNGPVCHELRYKELKDKEGNVILERDKRTRVSEAVEYIKKFKDAFGEDYLIELQMPGVADDVSVFRQLVTLADNFKIDLALANDCHYLTRKDFILQKAMMAIAQETNIYSDDLFHVNSDEQYMKTRAELWARFKNYGYSKGIPDSVFEKMCDNTLMVADRVKSFDFDPDPKIPNIPDADNELRRLVALRLHSLGLDKCTDKFIIDGKAVNYIEQSKIELNRFIDKGFSSYFLITRDLVQYGRERGWPFSPRGSAGGSLVCYLLGIHTLDPLLWGLSFDRFLSPSRGGYMLNMAMGEEIRAA
jgi:DNA polymerase III subunit alpha